MPLKNPFVREDNYLKSVFVVIAITLISLAFSIRILNTLSLILLVLITIVHPRRKDFIKSAFSDSYFLLCLLLFLLKAFGAFYSNYVDENIKQATGKVIWLAIPFFFCANRSMSARTMWQLMRYFSISLFIVASLCLLKAWFTYLQTQDESVFFYHALVKPFKHHAVFFSFYLFFCIVYWLEKGLNFIKTHNAKWAIRGLVTFFFIFIILLSSKLVIILVAGYLLYFISKSLIVRRARLMLLLAVISFAGLISVIAITDNPIRNRFSDAIKGNAYLFTQEKFSPATYFNGVQLRLLIWRFTYEILEERDAWLLGVSSGDAQQELNRKYEETNMYQGDGVQDTKGYKAFNCHNVFLQTTLESGLLGLFTLLALIGVFLRKAIINKESFALIFYFGMVAFCFTESVLTSQYTVLLFMFFPLLSLSIREKLQ